MASNIKDFEISKTFANVLLSNINAQPDTDGIPYDLSTLANRTQAQLQDGLGNSAPLFISRSSVESSAVPQTAQALVRKQEILEGITYFQTASLILG